jgi:hypothetical protein
MKEFLITEILHLRKSGIFGKRIEQSYRYLYPEEEAFRRLETYL